MSLINKRKVYNQCILPTVTYGAKTWQWSQKMMVIKLRAMQRAHEQSMMGLRWQDIKEASWIGEKTKVKDILETDCWRWLLVEKDNRWEGKSQGKVRELWGWPNLRWSDNTDNFIKEKTKYLKMDRQKIGDYLHKTGVLG